LDFFVAFPADFFALPVLAFSIPALSWHDASVLEVPAELHEGAEAPADFWQQEGVADWAYTPAEAKTKAAINTFFIAIKVGFNILVGHSKIQSSGQFASVSLKNGFRLVIALSEPCVPQR